MCPQVRIKHLQDLLSSCELAIAAQQRIINHAPEEGDMYQLSLDGLHAQKKHIQEDLAYLTKQASDTCACVNGEDCHREAA